MASGKRALSWISSTTRVPRASSTFTPLPLNQFITLMFVILLFFSANPNCLI
jgi:hypothetical protein